MAMLSEATRPHHSSLEDFVLDYVEAAGGAWDDVEPQVYDVLLPARPDASKLDVAGNEVLRVAFDPEALPEHPGAQLASFGTPLIDRLLTDAVRRGRYARFYFLGLNLNPHDLTARVRRSLALVANVEPRLQGLRALYFAQAVFWFRATFASDQKEEEVVPVALDLHYGRQVRHVEKLLDTSRLSEHPSRPLPEARRLSLAAAYPLARDEAVRVVAPLANTRRRELAERLERQIRRMTRYYHDLRAELDDQAGRARDDEARARVTTRREAVEREERLRVAELRQKSTLHVHLRLLNLAIIEQPKILLQCEVASPNRPSGRLELVWDPLLEGLEAVPCPACGRPTFAFGLTRQGEVICSACAESRPAASPLPRTRA